MRRANKMKVAMWIAKINNAPDFELRYQYAKLLLTILEEGVLLGPFVDEPPADLQPLPEEYSAPNIVEVLREQKERQGGSGDRPPVLTEVSSDLKEYAAAQLIPKFGVHCYYAVSDEPLPEWRQAGDAGRVSSAASAALPCDRPRTECDSDEVHRADCSLCAVTGSVLDEDQTDFRWMEGRPQQYYTPLGTERDQVTPPYFPGRPISPTSPLRASPGRPLSPASRLPRGPITSSPIAQQIRSPTTRTPHLEGPTSPATPWFSALEGMMLPSISDLSSTGAYGTPFTLSALDSTTRPPVIPAGDMSGRGPMLPFESGLSSLESFGTPLASMQQATPPTSGTTTPSLPSCCRSPHSGFSRSPASAGAAPSTPSGTPAVSPISPASYSPRAAVKAEPVDYQPSEQGHWSGYRVKQEQVFQESPSARGLPPGPSLRESPCDTGCSTTPQQQAAEAVASRPSPYTTSHVPAYGRTAESQPRIGEESLFTDLFGQEQPPQETIMSVVRRLRQQTAEGRERCRVYKAEIEASNRRREQIQAMRSRTPRTQAPTAAPMPSPHVAHPQPQPQQTPISRPVRREWPTTLPQFPDLFGQGPTESPIVQIARRLQQQNEESRERTRRRVAHREQRVRDRELMLQQATGETPRSRREPPEAAPTVRFKKEEQPSAAQEVEECVEECTEEAESPESSPQAATEESSPETSYEFPPPIWSSGTRAEHQFVPSRGYGEARYYTPPYRSPQVKTEESSPESGYEFAPSAWPSSRTDGHTYVSTPVYGEDRYQTTSQRGCEAPCGAESSESSPEAPLPPPLWSSARRDRSSPARRPPPGAPWDTY